MQFSKRSFNGEPRGFDAPDQEETNQVASNSTGADESQNKTGWKDKQDKLRMISETEFSVEHHKMKSNKKRKHVEAFRGSKDEENIFNMAHRLK